MNFYSFIYFLIILKVNSGLIKVENVTCKSLDKSFADFRRCALHTISNGISALDAHWELYNVPVKDVTTNIAVFKYENGYQPFLYNITWDFCAFMKNRKRLLLLKAVVDDLTKSSNINHTCPYAHDIIVKDWILRDEYLKFFPIPIGDYLMTLKVGVYDDWKADINLFLKNA